MVHCTHKKNVVPLLAEKSHFEKYVTHASTRLQRNQNSARRAKNETVIYPKQLRRPFFPHATRYSAHNCSSSLVCLCGSGLAFPFHARPWARDSAWARRARDNNAASALPKVCGRVKAVRVRFKVSSISQGLGECAPRNGRVLRARLFRISNYTFSPRGRKCLFTCASPRMH